MDTINIPSSIDKPAAVKVRRRPRAGSQTTSLPVSNRGRRQLSPHAALFAIAVAVAGVGAVDAYYEQFEQSLREQVKP